MPHLSRGLQRHRQTSQNAALPSHILHGLPVPDVPRGGGVSTVTDRRVPTRHAHDREDPVSNMSRGYYHLRVRAAEAAQRSHHHGIAVLREPNGQKRGAVLHQAPDAAS